MKLSILKQTICKLDNPESIKGGLEPQATTPATNRPVCKETSKVFQFE